MVFLYASNTQVVTEKEKNQQHYLHGSSDYQVAKDRLGDIISLISLSLINNSTLIKPTSSVDCLLNISSTYHVSSSPTGNHDLSQGKQALTLEPDSQFVTFFPVLSVIHEVTTGLLAALGRSPDQTGSDWPQRLEQV